LGADRRWVLAHLQFPKDWKDRFDQASDEDSFETALAEYFAQRPAGAHIGDLGIRNNSHTIANFHNGRLQLGRNDGVPFSLTPDWDYEKAGLDHTRELHSLRFLTNFMEEF